MPVYLRFEGNLSYHATAAGNVSPKLLEIACQSMLQNAGVHVNMHARNRVHVKLRYNAPCKRSTQTGGLCISEHHGKAYQQLLCRDFHTRTSCIWAHSRDAHCIIMSTQHTKKPLNSLQRKWDSSKKQMHCTQNETLTVHVRFSSSTRGRTTIHTCASPS